MASIALFLICVAIIIDVGNYWFPVLRHRQNLPGILFDFIFLVLVTFFLQWLDQQEKNVYNSERTNSPLQIFFSSKFIRLSYLCITIFDFLDKAGYLDDIKLQSPNLNSVAFLEIIHSALLFGFPVFAYLVSVNPLPPGKSKVRELIEVS